VGGLYFAAFQERRRRLPGRVLRHPAAPAVAAILLTVAAGWIDEGIQHLLPSRYYDLRDVGFNAAAGALAVAGMAVRSWARGGSAPTRDAGHGSP
jgi:VanZ family protein